MKTAENLAVVHEKHATEIIKPLRQLVRQALDNYFAHLDAALPPTQLYDLVLEEVEPPLLEATLKYTRGNQCKAAILLGISRSTLRKKLKHYDLD
ncbi:MAG TPA: DNA-binding transcriptional regulator Fis [Gammaproteobacteria bacterium]|nr:DNA-binding transcriptional regulator Fis [Gammaproteobacteria bacterium]